MPFCETPLLRIAYEATGPESGRPLLLLHGWPDDARTFDRVLPGLHAAGFRTYALWQRGFGETRFRSESTMRSGQLSALGQDALDFADALGLRTFSLVGHDWGARAAYVMACIAPERIERMACLAVGWEPGPMPTPDLEQARAYWYQWFLATDRGAEHVRSHGKAFARCFWDTWSPPGWFDEAGFER